MNISLKWAKIIKHFDKFKPHKFYKNNYSKKKNNVIQKTNTGTATKRYVLTPISNIKLM